jgi:hypothetical protein
MDTLMDPEDHHGFASRIKNFILPMETLRQQAAHHGTE